MRLSKFTKTLIIGSTFGFIAFFAQIIFFASLQGLIYEIFASDFLFCIMVGISTWGYALAAAQENILYATIPLFIYPSMSIISYLLISYLNIKQNNLVYIVVSVAMTAASMFMLIGPYGDPAQLWLIFPVGTGICYHFLLFYLVRTVASSKRP